VEETPAANDGSIVPVTSEEGITFGAQYPPAIESVNVRGMQGYHLNR
jgi:hypothetical protein